MIKNVDDSTYKNQKDAYLWFHAREHLSKERSEKLNDKAFDEINNVLFDFLVTGQDDLPIQAVCNAPSGHGKSTAVEQICKYLINEGVDQGILIAVREKHLAHEMYQTIKKIDNSLYGVINVDADNKDEVEDELLKYKVVIIQHQRLENLALGYGNPFIYSTYRTKKRLLIIDEKPNFADSAIFDIGESNNVLSWADTLLKPFYKEGMDYNTAQVFKSNVSLLVAKHTMNNRLHYTTKLIKEHEKDLDDYIFLIGKIKELREHEDNKKEYEALRKLKHFEGLIKHDEYGCIDDYQTKNIKGRKIIVSKYIDYSNLGMNILIFDATAMQNIEQYRDYEIIDMKNHNTYDRLKINIESINTSKYSRTKKDYPTQKTISKRIIELRETYPNLFVLPMKEEIHTYVNQKAILESETIHFMKKDDSDAGLNLLNTVGKNVLNNKTELYLTSLPKKNPDHYKTIAIAFYGTNIKLNINDEIGASTWFTDNRIEQIYLGDMYAEIIQIIHRTALRNIDSKDKINIFIAYDSDTNELEKDEDKRNRETLAESIVKALNNEASISIHELIDMSMYGRDKTLQKHIDDIKAKGEWFGDLPLSKVSPQFKKYVNNQYARNKESSLIHELNSEGYDIIKRENGYRYLVKI